MNREPSALQMLKVADVQLHTLNLMLRDSRFSDSAFGLHAYTATEMALRAWISFLGIRCAPSSDLTVLATMLRDNGLTLDGRFAPLVDLNAFGADVEDSLYQQPVLKEDRVKIVRLAEELVALVSSQQVQIGPCSG